MPSVYREGPFTGLAAADGVCAWLGEKRMGYEVGTQPNPSFSNSTKCDTIRQCKRGETKIGASTPPFRSLGVRACESASKQMDSWKDRGRVWSHVRNL